MAEPARDRSNTERTKLLALIAIAAVFSSFFFWNAYICDDAFIMLRTVDNLVRGHGLRWNVQERVQVFTSPLHTLVTAALYRFTYDANWLPNPNRPYFTSMFLSWAISLSGLLWWTARAKNLWLIPPIFLLLMSSQAFVTFTASGLESPLTYLLLILFYVRFLGQQAESLRAIFWLLVCAALAVVNRMDTALLFLPACLYLVGHGYRSHGLRVWRPVLLASVPIMAWFGFALVYFGFVFPNSYYAKLGLGADSAILYEMGRAYLELNLRQDPITLVAILLGILLSSFEPRTRLAGLGSLSYVVYIFLIGGDFIGFRFLAPPLLLSALVIQRFLERRVLSLRPVHSVLALAALLVYGGITPASPLRAYREMPRPFDVRFYFRASTPASWRPGRTFPFAKFHTVNSFEDCRLRRDQDTSASVGGGGISGFCRGPKGYLIAPSGITDPLIARLPLDVDTHFLPGHLPRPIPAGYLASVKTNSNRIRDDDLSAYYDKLLLVTRGPLFSRERWRAILELNLTEKRRYRHAYIQANPPLPAGFMMRHPSLVDRLSALK
jgi:arabinofuranosyltransferase